MTNKLQGHHVSLIICSRGPGSETMKVDATKDVMTDEEWRKAPREHRYSDAYILGSECESHSPNVKAYYDEEGLFTIKCPDSYSDAQVLEALIKQYNGDDEGYQGYNDPDPIMDSAISRAFVHCLLETHEWSDYNGWRGQLLGRGEGWLNAEQAKLWLELMGSDIVNALVHPCPVIRDGAKKAAFKLSVKSIAERAARSNVIPLKSDINDIQRQNEEKKKRIIAKRTEDNIRIIRKLQGT